MQEQRVDARVARIAARQHGVITVAQLQRAGLDKSAIARRVAAGRLYRVHRGVYAVGHPGLSREGEWRAATLACGQPAVLSHRSAGELWGLVDRHRGPIDVIVPVTGGRRQRPGLRIHRYPSLTRADATSVTGIPVTRPDRTLHDLRRVIGAGEMRRAVREAEVRGLPVDAARLIDDRTTSELKRRFLQLCRRERLPAPEVDARVGGLRVDFLWPAERVIVETDGYRYHRGTVAFDDDHARDNHLMALGYDVLRFTWRRVTNEPTAVADLVRSRLARAASTQSSR